MAIRILTQGNNIVWQDTTEPAGTEITRHPKKSTRYLAFPDVVTPANDYVRFFDSSNGSISERLRKDTNFLRTDLLNGDDSDALFADMAALNTYLSENTGNFSQAEGGGLAGEVKVSEEANLDINIDGIASTVGDITTVHENGNITLDWCANFETAHTFVLAGGTIHVTAQSRAGAAYVYTGVGTLFTGNGTVRISDLMTFESTAAGTFIDLTGGSFNLENVILNGWNSGTFRDGIFIMDIVSLSSTITGFTIENPRSINVSDVGVLTPFFGTLFTLNSNQISVLRFSKIQGIFAPSACVFDINPRIIDTAAIIIDGTAIGGGGDLFRQTTTANVVANEIAATIPATGTLTAMADNLSGGTTISCTTVYFEDEVLTLSGTTNYNGTLRIFNVVAGVSFDINVLFAGNDAAGSSDAERLTVTVLTGHGIVAGNNVGFILSTFYNAFYNILDTTATTVVVNGEFEGEDSFEIQNNVSINQQDPRVSSTENPGFINSNSIAFSHIEDNAIETTIATENVYQDINVMGSTGTITSVDDDGLGNARIMTGVNHGLVVNQNVKHRDTDIYNGEFRVITIVDTDIYVIDSPFTATATGFWDSKVQPGCNMELFRIVDQNTMATQYIGTPPFRGIISFIPTVVKQGNAEVYRWTIAIDGIVPQGAVNRKHTVTANPSSAPTLKFPVDLIFGQIFTPQVEGSGTTNNLTHIDATLST